MAATLIVYYSLEGNIAFVADALAKQLGAEVYRLETVKEYPKKGLLKFLHGGRDASLGFKPELKGTLPDLSGYEQVIVGTPVWAGKPSAPLAAFLDKVDFTGKKVSAFASSAGGSAEKCLAAIRAAAERKGAAFGAVQSFVNPLRSPEAALESVKTFAAQL